MRMDTSTKVHPILMLNYTDALAYAAGMLQCCGGQTAHLATVTSDDDNNFICQRDCVLLYLVVHWP